MKIKLGQLYSKIDTLEGHSRRKHLRINSIPRKLNELWRETEVKVRTFIRRDLDRPDIEDVEIERAHRVTSLDPNKCNIVVKFSMYKDRDQILSVGKQSLKNSIFFVQEYFTDRVKLCRRELGKRLVETRNEGFYALMRFDKQIIENDIYKYDVRKPAYLSGWFY